jgi:hypothetical protein
VRPRQIAERLGLARRPVVAALPGYRPPRLGAPEPRELPFGPVQTTDDWSTEFELWRGNKITVNVTGQTVQVQLARSMPPNPAVWGGPITLQPGPWSHVGPFGYFRFRSRTRGLPGLIEGTAYSE